ncbi:amidohydrolase [Paenalcaligenes sp. Me131]|uniref:amidohydrolase n=1 Tax=Paenalcaligenes sp. Me131 TaxID=3392636 RepID=UPI003D297264
MSRDVMQGVTVYKARKILTMNPAQPVATHVAVCNGRILAVGAAEQAEAWGSAGTDERYAEKVLMPGLVEGHCHLHEGVVWLYVYVGFYDRRGPDGSIWKGLKTTKEVVQRLAQAQQELNPGQHLIAWGFDPIYLGQQRMSINDLDDIPGEQAVVIMHASMHLMNVNSVALRMAGIDRDTDVEGITRFENGEPTGELCEFAAMFPVIRLIGNPFRSLGQSAECLRLFGQIAVAAGVTTATDLVNELQEASILSLAQETRRNDFPVRIVPAASGLLFGRDVEACLSRLESLKANNHEKLHLGAVKLVVDGAIQGFTARVLWPGYYNGAPNGIWVISPADLSYIVEQYHKAGVQLHIHTNGDEATEVTLDALERALALQPRLDHRHTLQHCQMASPAQYRRIKKLGLCVNLFSNHIFYWGDAHTETTIGPDRANRMNACATAQHLGIPFAIHSDAPITPLAPFFTAWCAVNRITASGRVLGESERISVADALRAITLGAAYTLGMDDKVGSVEVGKYADFCVLEDDPLSMAPESLKDVVIIGTMVGGRAFDVPRASL